MIHTPALHIPARPRSGPDVLVMGTPGHVAPRDMARRLEDMGGNAGNLIFQHAVARHLVDRRLHLSGPDAPWQDESLLNRARVRLFPAANHLRVGADWTGLCDWLDRPGPPLVVLGLGVQAGFGASVAGMAARLRADPQARRLAGVLRRRAAYISVRGGYSQEVCAALGISGTETLGCPSALLSPDPDLGLRVARDMAWLTAALRGKGGVVRAVMNATAPFEIHGNPDRVALEQILFDWIVTRRAGLYVQQSGGAVALHAATGEWGGITASARKSLVQILAPALPEARLVTHLARGGRVPSAATAWIEELAGCDLAIGTRVHGALAALAAGRPGVLIPHDARTVELAQTHHLPIIAPDDVLAAGSMGGALARLRFDPIAFDRARRASAAGLVAAFDRFGLTPAPALRRLAGAVRADHPARAA